MRSIYFADALTGYVVGGNGVMLKTVNAGANWTVSYISSNHLYDVHFLNIQTGYATGNYSSCLTTTNAGANWVNQQIPLRSGLSGILLRGRG